MVSLVTLLFTSILFALYCLGAFFLWQKKKAWSGWKLASFVGGCLTLGFAFSPVMVDYAHHNFRGHMAQHLSLGMLAPIGLVSGAPALLALHVLPKKSGKLLARIMNNKIIHFISHPFVALVMNIGGMYALYLTPLYNSLHDNAALHLLVHFHFLAAGYLFTWSMIGPDPAPRRPKLVMRLTALSISIAAHSFLSKAMFAYGYPKNSIHSEAEIQAAAKLMYYGGDLIELLLLIMLFTLWYQKKGKPHYSLSI